MSFMNNNVKTIDGMNTFTADIFNTTQELQVDGFGGSAGQFLKKNTNTNVLEWREIALSDQLTAGSLIDFSANTISVDLSEATVVTDMAITDSVVVVGAPNARITLNNVIKAIGTHGAEYTDSTVASILDVANFILYGAHDTGGAFISYGHLKSLLSSFTGSDAAHNIVEIRSANNDVLFNAYDTGRTFAKVDCSVAQKWVQADDTHNKKLEVTDLRNMTETKYGSDEHNKKLHEFDFANQILTIYDGATTNNHKFMEINMKEGKTTYYDSSAAAQSQTETNRIYMEMNHRTKSTTFYHYDTTASQKYKSFEHNGGSSPSLEICDNTGATTIKFDLSKAANAIGSINIPSLPASSGGGSMGDLYHTSGYLRVVAS